MSIQSNIVNYDLNFVKLYLKQSGTVNYPYSNRTCNDLKKLKDHVDKRHLNLQSTKKIFDKYNINWVLCGGSLLGPMRDGELILKDYDDDLWVFDPLPNECIKEFIDEGFTICRAETSYLLSIIRFGAPIDFCFRNIVYPGIYSSTGQRCNVFNESVKFYENMPTINLRGYNYPIPNKVEKYLEFIYADWKNPNPFGRHRGNNPGGDPYIVFFKEEEDKVDLNLYKSIKCREGKIKIFFI